jgi:hypothetical protein
MGKDGHMNPSEFPTADVRREALRKRMLTYGLVVSAVGLPVGFALGQPAVWGLAILGLVLGSIKMLFRGETKP